MMGVLRRIKEGFSKEEETKGERTSGEGMREGAQGKEDPKEEGPAGSSEEIKSREALEKDPRNKEIIEKIKRVIDPEINMDIWTLGLIYDIRHTGNTVKITFTLTSPMCPFGPQIMEELRYHLRKLGKEPELELVFSPPWQPSDELRELLGV